MTTPTPRPAAALLLPAAGPAHAETPGAVEVVKPPACDCCSAWVALAEGRGFEVEAIDVADASVAEEALGVPTELWSCHIATLEGHVIEGHVPLEAIERLLAERPQVAGLAVPGMPMGPPGMGDDPTAVHEVIAWGGEAGGGFPHGRRGPSTPGMMRAVGRLGPWGRSAAEPATAHAVPPPRRAPSRGGAGRTIAPAGLGAPRTPAGAVRGRRFTATHHDARAGAEPSAGGVRPVANRPRYARPAARAGTPAAAARRDPIRAGKRA